MAGQLFCDLEKIVCGTAGDDEVFRPLFISAIQGYEHILAWKVIKLIWPYEPHGLSVCRYRQNLRNLSFSLHLITKNDVNLAGY